MEVGPAVDLDGLGFTPYACFEGVVECVADATGCSLGVVSAIWALLTLVTGCQCVHPCRLTLCLFWTVGVDSNQRSFRSHFCSLSSPKTSRTSSSKFPDFFPRPMLYILLPSFIPPIVHCQRPAGCLSGGGQCTSFARRDPETACNTVWRVMDTP